VYFSDEQIFGTHVYTLFVLFWGVRVSRLFFRWVGCVTFIFNLSVETRAVSPIMHSLLASVRKLHKVVTPGSTIHSRLGVTEIVAFCILDFVHILITWWLDGLGKSKSTSQGVNKNINSVTYSLHHHYLIILPTL
jgi:hypothetical protein